MIVCWPSLFKIRLKHSVADLGEGPPPPTSSLFWVKKKNLRRKKSRLGMGQKTAALPPQLKVWIHHWYYQFCVRSQHVRKLKCLVTVGSLCFCLLTLAFFTYIEDTKICRLYSRQSCTTMLFPTVSGMVCNLHPTYGDDYLPSLESFLHASTTK